MPFLCAHNNLLIHSTSMWEVEVTHIELGDISKCNIDGYTHNQKSKADRCKFGVKANPHHFLVS